MAKKPSTVFCLVINLEFGFSFFLNSLLLGVGLAMDAFSVSMANAMIESKMKAGRMCFIASIYGFFQALMPLGGWFLVHYAAEKFELFNKAVPYIALALLGYIGGKMLYDGIKNRDEEGEQKPLTVSVLLVQGVATAIDALSVGFTISSYGFLAAFTESFIIAAVTFVICIIGLIIGKKFGNALSGKAAILGGAILILIGIEIFVKGVF